MTVPSPSLRAAWQRLASGRRLHAIAAALLPYLEDGSVDWAGFEAHVSRTQEVGLDVAVNMDTGFGDLLSPDERDAVLAAARTALGPTARFFAGAYPDTDPDPAAAYRGAIARIERHGATPVIVQSSAMHGLRAAEKAELYQNVARLASAGAIAFELSPRFAPHGEIWSAEAFERILEIPELIGGKHSSLERGIELERLACRDRVRPDWHVYTGNDLAIDMVAYGSDYLLGLATFAPSAFAARDAALAEDAEDFLARNDALQHLGNVGFREPIPAYKHSAAIFLELTGQLRQDHVHPRAPRRPPAERLALFDCARRLDLLGDPERIWRERVAPFLG